jgi:CSLREA domain-containing protein
MGSIAAVLAVADRPHTRIRPWPARSLVLLVATAALALLGLDGRALAQSSSEFRVNSTADKVDADLGDDTCDADPGPAVECTLRAAIIQANLAPGEQVIRLQARVYRLTLPGAGEDLSFTGDLDVTDAMQLVGATSGSARSTVDASGLGDRVLHNIDFGTKIQNLVITGGALPDLTGLSVFEFGGGIRTDRELTLTDSVVRGNSAEAGGGIFAFFGEPVTIDRSTISDNHATSALSNAGGGGIMAALDTPVIIRGSTVENNTTAIAGGGLRVGTESRIQRSLIAGNSAAIGGGISVRDNHGPGAPLLVENSTVAGNVATFRGGAIEVDTLAGGNTTQALVVLRAVTIAGNRSMDSSGSGGAVDGVPDVEAVNTVLANNVGGNCSFGRTFQSSSFNLSSDGSCGFAGGTSNQQRVSARLGPLQFNGGPTRTHALLEDSPAIDAGAPRGLCPLTDQRGGIRPSFLRNGDCDIGAFELNAVNVGKFKLTPKVGRVRARRLTKLKLSWWHPKNWRKLDTVDMQLRRKQATPLWVRFTQGAAKANGISATNGLTLYNSDGTFAGVGEPGRPRVLRSDTAVLDLARSRVRGSGPDGKKVTLALAVRLKQPAAGKRYTVTLLARDDDRLLQGPNNAGTLMVARP